jgi:hypothetical protein
MEGYADRSERRNPQRSKVPTPFRQQKASHKGGSPFVGLITNLQRGRLGRRGGYQGACVSRQRADKCRNGCSRRRRRAISGRGGGSGKGGRWHDRRAVMTKSAKRARSIKTSSRAAHRAVALADTWAKRTGMLLHLRELQTAEELARDIGAEGIAELRLDQARDDPRFQSFLTECVRPPVIESR